MQLQSSNTSTLMLSSFSFSLVPLPLEKYSIFHSDASWALSAPHLDSSVCFELPSVWDFWAIAYDLFAGKRNDIGSVQDIKLSKKLHVA